LRPLSSTPAQLTGRAGPLPFPPPITTLLALSPSQSHLSASPSLRGQACCGVLSPQSPLLRVRALPSLAIRRCRAPSYCLAPAATTPEPTLPPCRPSRADWFPHAELSRRPAAPTARCHGRLHCDAEAKRLAVIFPCTAHPTGPATTTKSATFRPPPSSALARASPWRHRALARLFGPPVAPVRNDIIQGGTDK
jgi:hypothetical protein